MTTASGILRVRRYGLTDGTPGDLGSAGTLGVGARARGFWDGSAVRLFYARGGAIFGRTLGETLSAERQEAFAEERLECEAYYLDRTSDRLKLTRKQSNPA